MSFFRDLLNDFTGRKAIDIQNVSKNQPSKIDVFKRIYQSQVTVRRDTIQQWIAARDYANSIQMPMRYELIRIYNNTVLDAQISAMIMQRKSKTLSKPFSIVDASGSPNQKATAIFQEKWFSEFLNMALDSVYFGHSLISLGDVVNDAFPNIQLVPREYVIPEREEYTTTWGAPSGISYVTPEYYNWYVGVGGKKNLGVLCGIVPYYIYKKNALAAWSEYTEVFGQPIRIGKTDTLNESMRSQLAGMLENMGSNSWAVLDNNDDVELVESQKTDAYKVFQEIINQCDGYISKAILGQTMTSDNGSSRSQAEVHERVANDIGLQDNRMIEYIVNDMLLPRMRSLGFTGLDGLKFAFNQGETLSLEQSAKIDEMFLKNGYLLPEDYILKKYGSPVYLKLAEATATKSISQGVANAKK